MGIGLLREEQYHELPKLGAFDLKLQAGLAPTGYQIVVWWIGGGLEAPS